MGIVAKFDKYLGTATKFSDLLDSDLPVLVDLPAGNKCSPASWPIILLS